MYAKNKLKFIFDNYNSLNSYADYLRRQTQTVKRYIYLGFDVQT